jgi:putative membrane protein
MIAKRSGKGILLCSAMFLLASLTAFVQEGSGATGEGQQPASAQPPLPGLGMAGPVTTVEHAFSDQAFLRSVMERNAGEVQMGQLAERKSPSADIKQLGKKIIENRSKLDIQFKTVAMMLDVLEPKGPSKKDKQLIVGLEGLSGSQFDSEYILLMVRNHRQDAKDFQVEAQEAEDPNVKKLAQQYGPMISQYLRVIEEIAGAHKIVIDARK